MKPVHIVLFVLLVLLNGLFLGKAHAQAIPDNAFYAHLSVGRARAEDGIVSLQTTDLQQMAPTGRFGIGYRINKFLAVEATGNTMLQRLKATGTRRLDNSLAQIDPLYSSLLLEVDGILPIGKRLEVLVGGGGGLLIESARITSSTGQTTVSESRLGYLIGVGVRLGVTERLAAQVRFELTNEYGSSAIWQGDAGNLSVGVTYVFLR